MERPHPIATRVALGRSAGLTSALVLCIFEKSSQQIERVEYLPKALYFTVHLKDRKNQTRKYLGDRFFSDEDFNFKEINLWLPGSVSSTEEKYPVTNELFQKMYKLN